MLPSFLPFPAVFVVQSVVGLLVLPFATQLHVSSLLDSCVMGGLRAHLYVCLLCFHCPVYIFHLSRGLIFPCFPVPTATLLAHRSFVPENFATLFFYVVVLRRVADFSFPSLFSSSVPQCRFTCLAPVSKSLIVDRSVCSSPPRTAN